MAPRRAPPAKQRSFVPTPSASCQPAPKVHLPSSPIQRPPPPPLAASCGLPKPSKGGFVRPLNGEAGREGRNVATSGRWHAISLTPIYESCWPPLQTPSNHPPTAFHLRCPQQALLLTPLFARQHKESHKLCPAKKNQMRRSIQHI